MPSTRTSSSLLSQDARHEKRWTVDIEMYDKDDRLKVRGMQGLVGYSEADVTTQNGEFVKVLEETRKDVQKLALLDGGRDIEPLDKKACDKYLKKLRKIGADAYGFLPQVIGEAIEKLEQDAKKVNQEIALDIRFPPEMAFLWEMMYTGPDAGSVMKRCFWGFRFPIGNLYWDTLLPDSVGLGGGIFASAHSQLPHSAEELEAIRQELDTLKQRLKLQVRSIFLDEHSPHILEEGLDEDEQSERLLYFFHHEDFSYGMVHFACHCENPPNEESVLNASLELTAQDKGLAVRLGKFRNFARNDLGFPNAPLVFLNACESGTPLHLLQSVRFPRELINFGAGGVIATSCTVPDNFASAFAAQFYQRLLSMPSSKKRIAHIGEALFQTRLFFLEERNNPLGLAYSLYTYSDQSLAVQ
jgi:hypothetical protein